MLFRSFNTVKARLAKMSAISIVTGAVFLPVINRITAFIFESPFLKSKWSLQQRRLTKKTEQCGAFVASERFDRKADL